MANTRYEWSVADLAIFGIKAITVPIYQNNTAEDVEFILNNCEARVLLCETRGPLKIFESDQKQMSFGGKTFLSLRTPVQIQRRSLGPLC